jgi:sugar/nucleoside kinase (ribokinase family)
VTPHGPQLGGTVSYAAQTAVAFGQRVGILTSATPGNPLLNDLPAEATVICVPAEHTTTFENIYSDGVRTQYLYHRAALLGVDAVPPAWRNAELIHLAPIAYEIDPALATAFGDSPVCVTPQGWMRRREPDSRVSPAPWDAADLVLPHAALTVLSEEDIRHDPGLEAVFARLAPLLVLTRAERGGTVYQNGRAQHFPSIPVKQVDPTGAGDIFATALHIALHRTGSLDRALRIATQLAGRSVTRRGIASVPTPAEVAQAFELQSGR